MLTRLLSFPVLVAACFAAGCAVQPISDRAVPDGATASLTLLETTDLHAHVLGYDYYRAQPDPEVGLARAATLITRARQQYPNTLLLDAGDTIQGTELATWQARAEPLACDRELAIYRAMDTIGYDAVTPGNHEFNFGLQYLSQVTGTPMQVPGIATKKCSGPEFPIVLSNVFSAGNGEPIFQPWVILERSVTASRPDGSTFQAPLSIGVLGFTPPRIMDWDQQNLTGKVKVMGVVEAARKYLPEVQAQNPDLIIAIFHGGLSKSNYSTQQTNAARALAQVQGIDAMLLGHMHTLFPGERFKGMAGVDDRRGTVYGVPAVMAGMFGNHLGLIHLSLQYRGDRWVSDAAQAHSETWPICSSQGQCVPADPRIVEQVAETQKKVVAHVEKPIGSSNFRMSSYFADLGDMTALAPVHAAQLDFARKRIDAAHPELAGIPLLSAAAAFRTGFAGPDDYTDVAAGEISIRNAADLYYYPNTLAAVKIDAAGLKAWLEKSAERFVRIDPKKVEPQALINPSFPGYNFDQIVGAGLHYLIDISRPAGERIVSLTMDGQPLDPGQDFILVTNNYRASGGGGFPATGGEHTVLSAARETRRILIDWLSDQSQLKRRDFDLDSWDFVPLQTRGKVTFVTASGKLGLAAEDGISGVTMVRDNGDGTSVYALDLSKAGR